MRYINIAYYRKEDWERFLLMADDRETLHDTWEEWHKSFKEMKKKLKREGFIVTDRVVNLNELLHYCLLRGIKIDGAARAAFVARPQ